MMKRGIEAHTELSRLFLYKVARRLLGWTGDTGAYIRGTVKAAACFGDDTEYGWGGCIDQPYQRMGRTQRAMISNDEVAGFVREAPDRLTGVGSVDISRPMSAVREIRRCVNQLGFKAIRVLPWLWELPPTHALLYPVYAECCALGVPFCT